MATVAEDIAQLRGTRPATLRDLFRHRTFARLMAAMTISSLGDWVGFVAVARYSSINEYLLPSALYVGALLLPLGPYVTRWDTWPVYLHPLQAPLVLMQAAFQPVDAWKLAYGVLYSALWIGLACRFSLRSFRHFVTAGAEPS